MLTPKQIARRSADAMWANDDASKWLDMELIEVDAGSASLTLTVAQHHTNGHDICHGGIIYALADSTFAFACNSRNQNTVAQHCTISYIAPARLNDRLTAKAVEVSTMGRNGIYDVKISNQNDEIIAEFRGFSRTIKGQLFQE